MDSISLKIGHVPNYATVTIGDLVLHFSYETVIGFSTGDTVGTIARENVWGPTTGKHLNRIQPDKSRRLSSADFEAALTRVLAARGLKGSGV